MLGEVFGWAEQQREASVAPRLSKDDYHSVAAAHLLRQRSEAREARRLLREEAAEEPPIVVSGLGITQESGVVLPTCGAVAPSSTYVRLPSRASALRRLALCAAASQPLVLCGPPASGKTRMVEHLRDLTGRKEFGDFHRLQVSDETDSRALLGGYTCAAEPGTFVWSDGMLTRQVNNTCIMSMLLVLLFSLCC